MGAKVADTKVARPGTRFKFVLLCSTAGTGAGVGGAGGDEREGDGGGGAKTVAGCGNSGADVTLLSACDVVKPAVAGWGVRGPPCCAAASVLGGGELEVVGEVVAEGLVALQTLFWGVETFPGAGAGAVFRALTREGGVLPPAGGGAGLERWAVPDFLPLNGAGGLLGALGAVVVVVLLEAEAVFGDDAFVLVGGARGASGFAFRGELGLFPTPTAAALLVAVGVAVVVIVAVAAAVGGGASSTSGLTTTRDVTGVTKWYRSERLVALSTRSL